MTNFQKLSLLFLRLALGWLYFYAGITKLLDPKWTAAGYLKGAQTLTPLYQWLSSPQNINWVNFLNEWGLTLVGLSLIFGVFLRIGAVSGILIMLLYYIPILNFPYVGKGTTSFLVDQHFIFVLVLVMLASFDAGKYWGLKQVLMKFFPEKFKSLT